MRGRKREEFRRVPTRKRERVYVYATEVLAVDWPAWQRVKKAPERLPRGKIVGTIDIVDCYWDEVRSAFAWVLKKPKRFRSPRKHKGVPQPNFWNPHLDD